MDIKDYGSFDKKKKCTTCHLIEDYCECKPKKRSLSKTCNIDVQKSNQEIGNQRQEQNGQQEQGQAQGFGDQAVGQEQGDQQTVSNQEGQKQRSEQNQQGAQLGIADQEGQEQGAIQNQGDQTGTATQEGPEQGAIQNQGDQTGTATQEGPEQGAVQAQGDQTGTATQEGPEQGAVQAQGDQTGTATQEGPEQGAVQAQGDQTGTATQEGPEQGAVQAQGDQTGTATQEGPEQGAIQNQGDQTGIAAQDGHEQAAAQFQQGQQLGIADQEGQEQGAIQTQGEQTGTATQDGQEQGAIQTQGEQTGTATIEGHDQFAGQEGATTSQVQQQAPEQGPQNQTQLHGDQENGDQINAGNSLENPQSISTPVDVDGVTVNVKCGDCTPSLFPLFPILPIKKEERKKERCDTNEDCCAKEISEVLEQVRGIQLEQELLGEEVETIEIFVTNLPSQSNPISDVTLNSVNKKTVSFEAGETPDRFSLKTCNIAGFSATSDSDPDIYEFLISLITETSDDKHCKSKACDCGCCADGIGEDLACSQKFGVNVDLILEGQLSEGELTDQRVLAVKNCLAFFLSETEGVRTITVLTLCSIGGFTQS